MIIKITDTKNNPFYNQQTGERIDSDSIDIVAVGWSRIEGTCLVKYAIGGYDNKGVFHIDQSYPIECYQFSRKCTPRVWNDVGMDDFGSITEDALRHALLIEPAIKTSVTSGKWKGAKIMFSLQEKAEK